MPLYFKKLKKTPEYSSKISLYIYIYVLSLAPKISLLHDLWHSEPNSEVKKIVKEYKVTKIKKRGNKHDILHVNIDTFARIHTDTRTKKQNQPNANKKSNKLFLNLI